MKNIFIKTISMMMCISISTQFMAQHIANHQWKNRVLVVYTLDFGTIEYINQFNEFKDKDEALQDRKLILYEIVKDSIRMVSNHNSRDESPWLPLHKKWAQYTNKKDKFQITLIGLDGGIKLKQSNVLKTEELFRIIDSMPMRRAEMRNKR
ncbi:MAG: DUF4174 domain-containing protein [Saprospiraceae bacterium]|nr:DUF4174 domain-containing protein [Saprospiraceae bacterium]